MVTQLLPIPPPPNSVIFIGFFSVPSEGTFSPSLLDINIWTNEWIWIFEIWKFISKKFLGYKIFLKTKLKNWPIKILNEWRWRKRQIETKTQNLG
jgi:hypothetical protein